MNRWFLLLLLILPWGLAGQARVDEAGLKALLAKDKVVVLDVRTVEEYAAGHLPGAVLLPYDAIDPTAAAKLIAKKTTPVVVYCHSGRRSAIAAKTLLGLGYTKVVDFGALSNWSGALAR
jgi:rhodanese-related sulfurtransferase